MTTIRWEPDARSDLRDYRRWLVQEAGVAVARQWIAALLDWVDELRDFPARGAPRDDLGQGVRTRPFKHAVLLAYTVQDSEIVILHLFARGRNITAADFHTPE